MRKEKIFKRISHSLNQISDSDNGKFVCPICLGIFTEKDLNTGFLSEEHIPPESIGHEIITLLCKRCNDLCGHSIDSERYKLEKLKIESSVSDPIRVKVKNEEGTTVNCDMVFTDGQIRILNLPNNNHPEDYENWEKTFEDLEGQKWDGYKFNFTTVEKINLRKARISDLKSAYLYMFIKLGYRYILRPNLNSVREQILNSEEKIIDNFSLSANNNPIKESEFLISQEPLDAVCVKIDHETIILPQKNSPLEFYKNLANSNPNKLTGKILPLPEKHEMVLDHL